ncbi:hypothetical protein QMS71_08695 [Cronobacter sakazakii]|uniref:hypothetical protein n=2 Tax=Enterobacteriaceae TaxID=543 RepID=UPI000F81D370|nr:hypothetical protein [Enterobacter hormaechei]EKM3053707.1 hypothetical protein [Escherichia coli]ELY2809109.1 hypothetical protein [Cronobacter sakazakii]MDI7597375.1 hypothetical protein [Cronobacter sakazakii]MDK1034615.1 hypothetical protein [Cronobacter sakazakii]MDK1119820.1 hypothetical protein [Cronobacter sakazakii]
MSIITTEVKALIPEEEAMIAALSNKLATSKPRPPTDEKKLTTDQIVQIKRACVMGHSAKAITHAFGVSLAYALKMKREYNPVKYQKAVLTLPEKAVMIQQMKADNLTPEMMGELLGINIKTVETLSRVNPARYLVDQMLPYDQVLANLRAPRYVANPVYKLGTSMTRVRKIIRAGRQQLRTVITSSKRAA